MYHFPSAKSPTFASLHTPETGSHGCRGDPSTIDNLKLMNSASARLLYNNQLLHLSGLRTPKTEVKKSSFHLHVYVSEHISYL